MRLTPWKDASNTQVQTIAVPGASIHDALAFSIFYSVLLAGKLSNLLIK